MPIYEYACEKCGKFEVTQKMSDPALKECPTCGQPVERLISSNFNIIFKGSGFYCTDNRKSSSGGGEDRGSSSSAGSCPASHSSSCDGCKAS